MSLQERIESRLIEKFSPDRMQLVNESHQHSGPGTETHFNLIIVSASFEGKSRVQRQRQVNKTLAREFDDGMHALTMKALTLQEWDRAGGDVTNPAPKCMGGSKNG